MSVRTTAQWLGKFAEDLEAEGFDEDFIAQALLVALENELKTDGLLVSDG